MSLWNENNVDAFPQPPETPQLDRRACLSPRGLRSFLKLSRHSIDDVLKQKLDSLISHSQKQPLKSGDKSNQCSFFVDQVVFPAWKGRLRAIEFCEQEASKLEKEVHFAKEETKVIQNSDLRLDPYAQRDIDSEREKQYAQIDSLRSWVRNERDIENIVQTRTLQILNDECGGLKDWLQEFKKIA